MSHAKPLSPAHRAVASALAVALAVVVVPLVTATPLAAQEADSTTTVVGTVVDGETGRPLVGVLVSVAAFDWGVMSGDDGRFTLIRVPVGETTLEFNQLGYADLEVTSTIERRMAPLRIELTPKPLVLEGIRVMADRFESRRKAVPTSVRAYEDEDLRYFSGDIVEFLRRRAFVHVTPCPSGYTGFNCVWRRGRIIQPRVVIDEFPAIGGLDELEAMPSNMIYMVEVYGNGSHIRVYTNQFIERLGRRPMAPIPLWW